MDPITKACYKNCPADLGRGFYSIHNVPNEHKECQSCDNPENEEDINEEKEGFYIKGENLCYSSNSISSEDVIMEKMYILQEVVVII